MSIDKTHPYLSPASQCRWLLFPTHHKYTSIKQIPEELDFTDYEERLYKSLLENLSSEQEIVSQKPESSKIMLIIYSLGLFCFGHIEALEAVITYFWIVPRQIRVLASVIPELLPVPKDIKISNTQEFKKWLTDCKSRIEWSEEKGKYLLN